MEEKERIEKNREDSENRINKYGTCVFPCHIGRSTHNSVIQYYLKYLKTICTKNKTLYSVKYFYILIIWKRFVYKKKNIERQLPKLYEFGIHYTSMIRIICTFKMKMVMYLQYLHMYNVGYQLWFFNKCWFRALQFVLRRVCIMCDFFYQYKNKNA